MKESAFYHLCCSALDEDSTRPGPPGPHLCPSIFQGLRERSSPEVLEGLVFSLPFGTSFLSGTFYHGISTLELQKPRDTCGCGITV